MKVLLGMSGGVDSSVAALLLLERGHDVVGVTFRLAIAGHDDPLNTRRTCCSLQDTLDARRVAGLLGINHYVINLTEKFEQTVIANFTGSYRQGLTPNPCVDCNRWIKFDELISRADMLGFDAVATGHYARVLIGQNGEPVLSKGADPQKDQTYFLWPLRREILPRVLFPLGELTKEQVREIAAAKGLINASKPDSQDICFVPGGDYAGFVEERSGPSPDGDFISEDGRFLGRHHGKHRYTIGQRRGIGLALGEPHYVTAIDPVNNTVTLGRFDSLLKKECQVGEINLVSIGQLTGRLRADVKIRSAGKPVLAEMIPISGSRLRIVFDQPQKAISPGQSAVFYDGAILLGGGIILPR